MKLRTENRTTYINRMLFEKHSGLTVQVIITLVKVYKVLVLAK